MATLTPNYAFRNYVAPGPDGVAQGTSGNDDIYATANGQTLVGGGGDDVFHIGTYTDVQIVVPSDGSGINEVSTYLSTYTLPPLVDNLSALGDYPHTLTGNDSPDGNVITGAGGADHLFGGGGPDYLLGGGGNDVIDPGPGADFMDGQGGSDTFVITAGNGSQGILNFTAGAGGDVVNLVNSGFTSFQDIRDHMTGGGGITDLHLSNGQTLDFSGFNPNEPFTFTPGPNPDQFVESNFILTGTTAPPPATGTLVLHMSEDAFNGDAQFTVFIDGHQLDGVQTATASHALGQTQDITLTGSFDNGQHVIDINFINDAWGGSPSEDRNLYVQSLDINGEHIAGTAAFSNTAANGEPDPNAAALRINGTAEFNSAGTAPPNPTTLVLHVSEDAWNGDAQFTITVDGQELKGVQGTTASHGLGQVQDITITGNFGSLGPDTVAINYINDAWGGSADTDRNLYVQSIDVNGVHFAGNTASNTAANGAEASDPSAAVMDVNGTATFHIDHSAPPEIMG
jgi:hypothetical protein